MPHTLPLSHRHSHIFVYNLDHSRGRQPASQQTNRSQRDARDACSSCCSDDLLDDVRPRPNKTDNNHRDAAAAAETPNGVSSLTQLADTLADPVTSAEGAGCGKPK